MDASDEIRAKQIIERLKSGILSNKPIQKDFYTPTPDMIDNQEFSAGVKTSVIPGIGVVAEGANISTNVISNKKGDDDLKINYPVGVSMCEQCKTYHPVLQAGEKCPMAPVTITTPSGVKKTIDVTKFLDKMKVIFISQLEQKNIVDPDDFEKYLIIETTKIIEKYGGPGWNQQL